jgi:hypothetical protein
MIEIIIRFEDRGDEIVDIKRILRSTADKTDFELFVGKSVFKIIEKAFEDIFEGEDKEVEKWHQL